ncbi:hypothetical protein DL98DRAFT_662052 [Cadophora sp. DSE1049]|nr:hypothetical protein DL98DRAFT_662052 [Cadophora sp. DSE1049]
MATVLGQEGMRPLARYLSFRSTPVSTPSIDIYEARFLGACSGRDIHVLTPEFHAYLLHLKLLVDGKWTEELDAAFHSEYPSLSTPFKKVVQLCSEVAEILRACGAISISKMIQRSQLKRIFREDHDLQNNPFAQNLIFSSLGWLSLLYVPSRRARSNDLRITIQSTKSAIRSNVAPEMISRPLDELLRSFGDLLPRKIEKPSSNGQGYTQEISMKFHDSHLNVATMKDIANMQIVWVDSLSAHLEFDPAVPSSEDSTLAITLRQVYEEEDNPSDNFSVTNMLGEVMLSCKLLFRDDRRSRRVYQKTERSRAFLAKTPNQIQVDPYLNELCGNHIPSTFFTLGSSVHDVYDSDSYFPIYKERLKKIHDYIEGIQPNRFMSLWHDRRDIRLWYTVWTVIILGVLSLVQTTIGLFLSAAQVDLARKAYKSSDPPAACMARCQTST